MPLRASKEVSGDEDQVLMNKRRDFAASRARSALVRIRNTLAAWGGRIRTSASQNRNADTAVPDADFNAASAVFSEKELADLTIAIGLMNAYNRLAIGFQAPPKAALVEHQDQIVAGDMPGW
jgi:hypothetical protein